MKEKKKEAFELSWACIAIRYCTCASVPPQYCYCDGDGSPRAISHCDPAIRYSDCDNGTTTEDEYCLLFRGSVPRVVPALSRPTTMPRHCGGTQQSRARTLGNTQEVGNGDGSCDDVQPAHNRISTTHHEVVRVYIPCSKGLQQLCMRWQHSLCARQ